MSLQVWLPLDGSLENRGLGSNVTAGADLIYDNNGKIGEKSWGNRNTYIRYTLPNIPSALSICLWVKPHSPNAWSDIFSLGQDDNRFEKDETSNYRWYCNTSTTTLLNSSTSLFNLDNEVWNHICMTADGSKVKFYLNGILQKEVSQNHNFTTVFGSKQYINIGSRIGGEKIYLGYFNDVRIYNHALSAREVKEIAQAKVLHYPLGANYKPNNLLDGNTHLISAWTGEAGTRAQDGDSIKFTSNGANQRIHHTVLAPTWQTGQKYTFSCWAKSDVDGTTIDGSRSLVDYTPALTVHKDWTYCKGVITSTDTPGGGSLSIRINQANRTVWLKDIKLEKGVTATQYYPGTGSSLYNAYPVQDTIEYDISGYNHHGTIQGTVQVDSNSKRYSTSYYFNKGSWINAGRDAMVKDSITVCCWAKRISGQSVFSCTETGGWAFQNDIAYMGTGTSSNYYLSTTLPQSTYSDSKWHYIAMTYDGFVLNVYLDGQPYSHSSTLTTKTPIYYNPVNVISIGAEAVHSTSSSADYVGNISDFRIYATALSASDIQELYNLGREE